MDYRNLSFVIVGPGHTGSTWLEHLLRATEGVFVTQEINYLTWTNRFSSLGDHFRHNAEGSSALGEHSNNYFATEWIPESIYKINPRMKIVISVRNPVKRVLSNYRHDRRWGILPPYISLSMAILPQFFWHRYINTSNYTHHIQRWLDWFSPTQIYLFRSPADIGTQPDQARDLVHFLGADRPGRLPDVVNEGRLPLFPQLHRHATYGAGRMTRGLCRLFDPINVRLGGYLAPPPYDDDDVSAVRDALGDAGDLSGLAELAVRSGIAGSQWLDPSLGRTDRAIHRPC